MNRRFCQFNGLSIQFPVLSHALIVLGSVRVCVCLLSGLLKCEKMGEKRGCQCESNGGNSHMCESLDDTKRHCVLRNTFHQRAGIVIPFHFTEYLSHQSAT